MSEQAENRWAAFSADERIHLANQLGRKQENGEHCPDCEKLFNELLDYHNPIVHEAWRLQMGL